MLSNPASGGVAKANSIEGVVGHILMLELCVEGLQVAAVVDTASNSSIISRPMLHSIKNHLQFLGKPIPNLELPSIYTIVRDGRDEGEAPRHR